MRVSKPGVDVLTAAERDLTFNSQWSMLSLLQKGSFFSHRPDGYLESFRTVTVYFNRSYARRPMVFLSVIRHGTTFHWQHIGSCLNWFVSPTRYTYMCNVFNDRFAFTNFRYPNLNGGEHLYDYTVRYLIWDYDV
ncbi:hypothetical protein NA2_19838 [Nitratireductor pacificus pht-3B]|uniref:Uncharacterized protein n=2 Tax=Nitratireductor TaxID=245876 RepID=K2M4P6_9HYPH|nr:hypothetical protein NA2_19838 [Nitratireductor pacificus pht-3B]